MRMIVGRASLLLGGFEVLPGLLEIARAPVELTERGVEEMIILEGLVPAGFFQGADARGGTFDLGDDDRPVEQVDRRPMNREQRVVEEEDRRPVRLGIALGRAMMERDAGFEMKGGDGRSLGRVVEEFLGAADQALRPTCVRSWSSMSKIEP